MTTATATAGSPILYRSRRRIAAWALALALGGAAAGTATTLAVTHDNNSASKAVPAAVVPAAQVVSSPHAYPATADGAERWTSAGITTPGANADAADSFNYKLGPGPR
jgi:hypothetical protein